LEVKAQPPKLSYPGASDAIEVRKPVLLTPEVTPVSELHGFSVEPALPEGLRLHSETGVISGCPLDLAERSLHTVTAKGVDDGITYACLVLTVCAGSISTFTVTAHNSTGPISVPVDLGLEQTPLVYPAASFRVGEAAKLTPKVAGALRGFCVEPALPPNLLLDPITGVIQGTPSGAASKRSYTVEAQNTEGMLSSSFALGVQPALPILKYPSAGTALVVGEAAVLAPMINGTLSEFSVDPTLPAGLVLDASTGVISGIPSSCTDRSMHTILGRNAECTAHASVVLTVHGKILSVAYPHVEDALEISKEVSITPLIEDEVDVFAVDAALPAGLSLDPGTGVIRGIPIASAKKATYVIKASSALGTTSAPITLAVTETRSANKDACKLKMLSTDTVQVPSLT
jgi:hypothetical protein